MQQNEEIATGDGFRGSSGIGIGALGESQYLNPGPNTSNQTSALTISGLDEMRNQDASGRKREDLLLRILTRRDLKSVQLAMSQWRLKSVPAMMRAAVEQMLCNEPISKMEVFDRLLSDVGNKTRGTTDKTRGSAEDRSANIVMQTEMSIPQEGNRLFRMDESDGSLRQLVKLHERLGLLRQAKKKEIMEALRLKIDQAEGLEKHSSFKNTFETQNNHSLRKSKLQKLLARILFQKAKKYFEIWFVKSNSVILPSVISCISHKTSQNKEASTFWAELLGNPRPSMVSSASSVVGPGVDSKLKENIPLESSKDSVLLGIRSTLKESQLTPTHSFRKMFIDEKPLRSPAGLILANSFSYLSNQQSVCEKSPPNKDLTLHAKYLRLLVTSLVRTRLIQGLNSIKITKEVGGGSCSAQTKSTSRTVKGDIQILVENLHEILQSTLQQSFEVIKQDSGP